MANGSATPGSGVAYLDFEKPIAKLENQIEELQLAQEQSAQTGRDFSEDIKKLRGSLVSLVRKTYANLNAWETVQVARHQNRPVVADYLDMIVGDFRILHGDRCFRDDKAIITGFGRIRGRKVMIIGNHKGRLLKEKVACNFGCAHPEGYRKAQRVMKLARKYALPIVCLIDTSGAYPGVGSEERSVAHAIAENLSTMSRLQLPIVCVVVGEGGSGGALGIGVGDKIGMLQHAYYSVIPPEGCAAILWKSGEYAKEAALALKPTAKTLLKQGIIDDIIPEPLGGAHRDPQQAGLAVENYITRTLGHLSRVPVDKLVERRYQKLRIIGSLTDGSIKLTNEKPAKKTAEKKKTRAKKKAARHRA